MSWSLVLFRLLHRISSKTPFQLLGYGRQAIFALLREGGGHHRAHGDPLSLCSLSQRKSIPKLYYAYKPVLHNLRILQWSRGSAAMSINGSAVLGSHPIFDVLANKKMVNASDVCTTIRKPAQSIPALTICRHKIAPKSKSKELNNYTVFT